MRKITSQIWLGNSNDAENTPFEDCGINAMLNVAHDLQGTRGYGDGMLYAQCGLVDGPGNPRCLYAAAILLLTGMVRSNKRVIVVCHNGESRSLAVALGHLELVQKRGLDMWMAILREKCDLPEDVPHEAHVKALKELDWKALEAML